MTCTLKHPIAYTTNNTNASRPVYTFIDFPTKGQTGARDVQCSLYASTTHTEIYLSRAAAVPLRCSKLHAFVDAQHSAIYISSPLQKRDASKVMPLDSFLGE